MKRRAIQAKQRNITQLLRSRDFLSEANKEIKKVRIDLCGRWGD